MDELSLGQNSQPADLETRSGVRSNMPPMGLFNVHIPQPFSLARHSDEDKRKLYDECIAKIKQCEASLSAFYGEYNELSDMWRVKKRAAVSQDKPRGLFSSRVGEMHRAVEALATFWYRVVTSNDPFFEAVREGLDQNGYEISSETLFGIEQLILKQLYELKFKQKLLTVDRSIALFGTCIVSEPWAQKPITGQKYFEGTDFQLEPLIKTFFDANVFDIEFSDFIAKADYLTKSRLQGMAYSDKETWDQAAVSEALESKGDNLKAETGAWSRIQDRKSRAGYTDLKGDLHELISYYGRLSKESIETGLIQDMWAEKGDDQDPMQVDFTLRFLNGGKLVCADPCQYGDWHTAFKTASVKQFECEPLGYGAGRVGRKSQNEMDFSTSNANNLLTMSLYNMWKVSKYANLKSSQLGIRPLNLIEMEGDTNQLEPLRPDTNAIAQAINVLANSKSDFRATTGATDTLQAVISNSSATEASLVQNEAVRSASVHGELIGESLLRDHLNTCYLNNLNLLDNPIWVTITGGDKPKYLPMSKQTLPTGVGLKIKITTDKDFNSALDNALKALQLVSSVRQFIPTQLAYNAISLLLPEIIRLQHIDPKLLKMPIPMKEELQMNMRQQQMSGGQGGAGGQIGNEVGAEVGDEMSGGGHLTSTPMGMVPTSPNQSALIGGGQRL